MIVTVLTDFGGIDHYVAAMKGVILGNARAVTLVDISHEVPPQDVRHGAFLLACCWRDFPDGTIHLAVVDPGVGSDRRPIAIHAGGQYFVGPDNGLFTYVLADDPGAEVRAITASLPGTRTGITTFHGRDIFAPVAAALATGTPFQALGSRITDPVCLSVAPAAPPGRDLTRGEIIHIDHFGNCVTSFLHTGLDPLLDEGLEMRIGPHRLAGILPSYSASPDDLPFIIRGSSGFFEISVKEGSAARALDVARGTGILARIAAPPDA